VIEVENSLQSYISVGVYPPEEVEDGGEVPENVWGIHHGRDGPGRVRFYTFFLRNMSFRPPYLYIVVIAGTSNENEAHARYMPWFVSLRNIPNISHVHELDFT